MTIAELYNSTAQLGFETSLEDDRRFLYSANRALFQVAQIRPETRSIYVNHFPLKNEVREECYDKYNTKIAEFHCVGAKSYYFEVSGIGRYDIEYLSDKTWIPLFYANFDSKSAFEAKRGIINAGDNADVRITIRSDYNFSVKNAAMYTTITSNDEKDIPPYGEYTEYDLRNFVDDFWSLSLPPILLGKDENEMHSRDFCYDKGSVVRIPNSAIGVYKVVYNHAPRKIEDTGGYSTDQTVIDLAEDLCALLPLLIASFVLVEDEPEMANYYLNVYRERKAEMANSVRNLNPIRIYSRSGW